MHLGEICFCEQAIILSVYATMLWQGRQHVVYLRFYGATEWRMQFSIHTNQPMATYQNRRM